MAQYTLDIDSYIGSWLSGKRHVKNTLAQAGKSPVTVRVNSLGGSLDDGIDIAAQFEAHGNVTCDLFALNASAATVLTLGAKRVRMHVSAAYLIHKVLTWVDTWGYMNEDDIETAIEDLRKQKNNAASLTLTIAKMYAHRSGKPVNEILKLMKEETWLTAQEAKDWGFVDEVFSDSTIQPVNLTDERLTSMINVAGLPPYTPTKSKTVTADNESSGVVAQLIAGLKDIFNPTNKTPSEMNKTFILVNTILNIEGIEFKNGKAEITEDQVKLLNEAIKKAQDEKAAAEKLASERETTINELNTELEALKNADGDDTTPVPKGTDDEGENNDDFANTLKNARELYKAFAEE